MANTNRRRGKIHQKVTAESFKGLDIGIKGGEDVYHKTFSIECKSVMKFVGEGWYKQAEKNKSSVEKIPIVVIHIKHKEYDDDYVLIKKKDFLNLFDSVI